MTCSDEARVTFDNARYLAAKTTVDDRALNRQVLAELRRLMPAGRPQVLEVGAGLGTMVARLTDWGVVGGRRVRPAGRGPARAGLFSRVAARLGDRAGPAQRPAAGWVAGG